jgi:hypothetical protein
VACALQPRFGGLPRERKVLRSRLGPTRHVVEAEIHRISRKRIRGASLHKLSVDIPPISDFEDRAFLAQVVDQIDDSVVALPDSIPIVVASEFLGSAR